MATPSTIFFWLSAANVLLSFSPTQVYVTLLTLLLTNASRPDKTYESKLRSHLDRLRIKILEIMVCNEFVASMLSQRDGRKC